MKSGASALLLLTLLATGASGCGQASAPPSLPTGLSPTLHAALYGELTDNVTWENSQPNLADCDRSEMVRRRELVEELDRRNAELEAFSRRQAADALPQAETSLGPVRMFLQAVRIGAPRGRVERANNWQSVFANFAVIRDRPVDAAWLQLNIDVRVLLGLDSGRLQGFMRPGVDIDGGPRLKRIARELNTCLANPRCVAPILSSEDQVYLASTSTYAPFWRFERGSLKHLAAEITTDLKRYVVTPQPGVFRMSPDTYLIMLAAGDFAGAEKPLADMIEAAWRGGPNGENVKVVWTKTPASKFKGYSLVLAPGIGGRSFVDLEKRQVTFYDNVDPRAIPHEIGHALGFLDSYFTTFREVGCNYVSEADDRDLMSDLDGRYLKVTGAS